MSPTREGAIMGYCANIIAGDFTVMPGNAAKFVELACRQWEDGVEEVDRPCWYKSVADVLMDCGLDCTPIDGGGVCCVWWADDNKYRRHLEEVLGACAPAVEAGSHIDFYGEDDCIWRLAFDGKEMEVIDGRIVFDC